MLDHNPLRAKMPPNDSAYAMCVTRYMYGPLHQAALKVLAQAQSGVISYRFGMMALARLSQWRCRSAAQRLHPNDPIAHSAL